MDRILKAWALAHGERNIGNHHAAETAEGVAQSLEAKEGLAVWTIDRRRRSWVPSLWRRIASRHGVGVLLDEDDRLVLFGPLEGLESTRSHAVQAEGLLSERDDNSAWSAIAILPGPDNHYPTREAELLAWVEVRLNCSIEREPEVEIE